MNITFKSYEELVQFARDLLAKETEAAFNVIKDDEYETQQELRDDISSLHETIEDLRDKLSQATNDRDYFNRRAVSLETDLHNEQSKVRSLQNALDAQNRVMDVNSPFAESFRMKVAEVMTAQNMYELMVAHPVMVRDTLWQLYPEKKIEQIKCLRDVLKGAGLKECKDFVDASTNALPTPY